MNMYSIPFGMNYGETNFGRRKRVYCNMGTKNEIMILEWWTKHNYNGGSGGDGIAHSSQLASKKTAFKRPYSLTSISSSSSSPSTATRLARPVTRPVTIRTISIPILFRPWSRHILMMMMMMIRGGSIKFRKKNGIVYCVCMTLNWRKPFEMEEYYNYYLWLNCWL